MNKSICFFSVVYPAVQPFLADFFASLDRQTAPNMDIVIGVDSWPGFERFVPEKLLARTKIVDCKGTPAEVRDQCFSFICRQGYDHVVIGDSDDTFSDDRAAIVSDLLGKYDIVVNDFDIVNEKNEVIESAYLSSRLKDGHEISFEMILDHNSIGLSIAAVRSVILKGIKLSDNVPAIDWHLFTRLLHGGARAVFTAKTKTLYRVHGKNTLKLSDFSADEALTVLRAKAAHYRSVAYLAQPLNERRLRFESLLGRVSADKSLLEAYVGRINSEKIFHPLWFENCKYLEVI